MTNDIIDKLILYFTSKGYLEYEIDKLSRDDKPELAFKRGNETLSVYILDIDSLSGKGAIMKKIAEAITDEVSNFTYIAVLSEIESLIDHELLSKYGVGLLVINEDVEEKLSAKRRESRVMKMDEEIKNRLKELELKAIKFEKAIVELESMISRMEFLGEPTYDISSLNERLNRVEREIERIKSELSSIHSKLERLESKIVHEKAEVAEVPLIVKETEVEVTIPSEGLPSFFKDNPWLNILSTRGRKVEEA